MSTATRSPVVSITLDPLPTVFLHGGWRCGSTYVWSRFRASPLTTCFYEPFSERLAHSSVKRDMVESERGWDSRHPRLSAPYRVEYMPLLRRLGRGVPGYRRKLALLRYFPRDGIKCERSYLERLIRYARERDTRPVLGFSRSLGRAAALKRALGGYHIVIRRDPRQQWLSCRSFRQSGQPSYFELCHMLILALAKPDSPAGALARSLGLPRPSPWTKSVRRQIAALHSAIYPYSDELSYGAFIGVYLLSYAVATPAADLVLDVKQLSEAPQYRDSVSAHILGHTGIPVDFSDCEVPPNHDSSGIALNFADTEADITGRLIALGVGLDGLRMPLATAP